MYEKKRKGSRRALFSSATTNSGTLDKNCRPTCSRWMFCWCHSSAWSRRSRSRSRSLLWDQNEEDALVSSLCSSLGSSALSHRHSLWSSPTFSSAWAWTEVVALFIFFLAKKEKRAEHPEVRDAPDVSPAQHLDAHSGADPLGSRLCPAASHSYSISVELRGRQVHPKKRVQVPPTVPCCILCTLISTCGFSFWYNVQCYIYIKYYIITWLYILYCKSLPSLFSPEWPQGSFLKVKEDLAVFLWQFCFYLY